MVEVDNLDPDCIRIKIRHPDTSLVHKIRKWEKENNISLFTALIAPQTNKEYIFHCIFTDIDDAISFYNKWGDGIE